MIKQIKLYYYTIKYLKKTQIFYRIYYFIKKKIGIKVKKKKTEIKTNQLIWNNYIEANQSLIKYNTFNFLNITHTFKKEIDWNISNYGKLWTYNLNYFDFLNQADIPVDLSKNLIKTYIKNNDLLTCGKEPYPISLRTVNWIKFMLKNQVTDNSIDQYLYNDFQNLYSNLEYHLLGNHLLENAFSLFFGAYYFNDKVFYKKSIKILKKQLNEQILNDGAHYELSPMYHQILLFKLLDCIYLIKLNNIKDEIKEFLIKKAQIMLAWLEAITYRNGNIPMVNDSTFNIAPKSEELFNYAKKIGLKWKKVELKESGYRKYTNDKYELFIDIGVIKANYQPGHTHSDIFNFEVNINNNPFIVDTGISTYEKNSLRFNERSTKSHNTLMIDDFDPIGVWGGFRVAYRPKVKLLIEKKSKLTISHNGFYKKFKINHFREFIYKKNISITDTVDNSDKKVKVGIHLHPNIQIKSIEKNIIHFKNSKTNIKFAGNIINIKTENYNYCLGFNKRKKSTKIIVLFTNKLTTYINI